MTVPEIPDLGCGGGPGDGGRGVRAATGGRGFCPGVDEAVAGRVAVSALAVAGGVALAFPPLKGPRLILGVADLPYPFTGQPDQPDDLVLPAPLVAQDPDRVEESGVRGFFTRLVPLVLACELPHFLIVHDPTIQCANYIDKRPLGRP